MRNLYRRFRERPMDTLKYKLCYTFNQSQILTMLKNTTKEASFSINIFQMA